MNDYEPHYLSILNNVRDAGHYRESRAGKTVGQFGIIFRVNSLRHGLFPVLTTRRMFVRPIFAELAGFLRGYHRLADFKDLGCNYWDMNAAQWGPNQRLDIEDHDLGRIYGVQWRDWEHGAVDQLAVFIEGIKTNPYGRRHLLTTWNPAELDEMALPPCHILVQAYVDTDRTLSLSITMRSVDLCLGLPSDVVLYAAFLVALCKETGYTPGDLVWQLGDAHIYENHLNELIEQLKRKPDELPGYDFIGVHMDRFHPDDLKLIDYKPQERINYVLN